MQILTTRAAWVATLTLACTAQIQAGDEDGRREPSGGAGGAAGTGGGGAPGNGGAGGGGAVSSGGAAGKGTGVGGSSGAGGSGGGTAGAGASAGSGLAGGGGDSGTGGIGTGGSAGGVAGSGGAAGTGGTGDPPTGILARDVALTLVEANQSTAVALGKAGAVLPVDQRNAELVEGRPTLVRAHFDVGTAWTDREILGVLTLGYMVGAPQQRTATKTVTQDSNGDELDSTFNFLLAAGDIKPGMTVSVELQETTPPTTPDPNPAPRFPAQGAADLGIRQGLMELKVVVVPAQTSGGFPESTDERRKNLHDHLFDIYPVQKVVVDWHAPVPHAEATSSSAAFDLLRDLCNQEGAPANVVYHMIIRDADSGFSFAGVASGGNTSTRPCRAVSLTSVSNARGGSVAYIDGNVDTVAHELGHNHGRRHTDCGGPAGPDPDFPYPDGFIGAQGYSVNDNALKPTADFRDLMSYCRPRWVSDWMWNRFAEKVREMTAWAQAPVLARESGRSLSGYVEANGSARWAVVPGELTEPGARVSSASQAKFWVAGSTRVLPISVIPSCQPSLVEVVATLPPGPLPTRAEIVVDGTKHAIDLSRVKKY